MFFCSGVCRKLIGMADKYGFLLWCLPQHNLGGRQIRIFYSDVCRRLIGMADKYGFFALVSAAAQSGWQTNQDFLLWCLPQADWDGRQIWFFCSGVCRSTIWVADKSGFFALVSAAAQSGWQTNMGFSPWCLPPAH